MSTDLGLVAKELVESGFIAYRDERIGDAIELFKSAVNAALSAKPPEAKIACQALADLSGLYSLRGDWERTQQAVARLGEIINSHGLHDSLQHLELLERLAELRANQEDVGASMGLRREALAMARRMSNPAVRSIAIIKAGVLLARGLCANGDAQEAEAVIAEILPVLSSFEMPSHDRRPARRMLYVDAHAGISDVFTNLGRMSDAEAFATKTLSLTDECFGDASMRSAEAGARLGAILMSRGEERRAADQFTRALEIARKTNATGRLRGRLINNLGMLALRRQDYAAAQSLFEESLDHHRSRARGKDPEVGIGLNNIGVACREQGKLAEAEQYQLRAITELQKSFEPEHPQVANAMKNLALLRTRQNRHAEAVDIASRALGMVARRLGQKHPKTQELREVLKKIRGE